MRNAVLIVVSVLVAAAVVLYLQFGTGEEKTEPVPALRSDPTPPAAETPAETPKPQPAQVIAPSFDVVRVSREGTGVIAGRAAPDSDVTVLAGERVIGRVTANRNGEWVLIFQDPLPPGSQELSLMARKGSAAPIPSEDVVVVSIPERLAPQQPRPQEEGVVAVLTPRDGSGPSRVLQQPSQSSSPIDDLLTIDTLDYTPSGTAVMTGRAMPETEIRIYLDGEYLSSVTTDAEGRWLYEPEETIDSGDHVLRLDQVLDGDNVRLRIEQPFSREAALDRDLAEGQVEVQPGNNLWAIARRLYGAGVMYTLIFQENKGRIVDPDLIYPNQLFKLPRATDAETMNGEAAESN